MKHLGILATAIALAACSSGTNTNGTTTGGGSQDAGSITINFLPPDIHPAAKAALIAAGAPVPSLVSPGPADAGYKLIINGVSLGSSCPGSVCLETIFSTPITSNGSYTYTINIGTLNSKASLGVLAGISPQLPDGGTLSVAAGAGLPQLPCSEVEGDGGIAAALTAAAANGLNDYFFPSGAQVGGAANPPGGNVFDAGAYAVPMSYASMLNCAGNPNKTTSDSTAGVALVYITSGGAPADGAPVAGASVALQGVSGVSSEASPVYYTSNYSALSTTSATDSTGVATYTGITISAAPPTLKTVDSASDAFFAPGIDTASNSFFSTFVFKP